MEDPLSNRIVYYYVGASLFCFVVIGVAGYFIYNYGKKAKFTHMSAIGSMFTTEGDETEVFSDGLQFDSLTSDDL